MVLSDNHLLVYLSCPVDDSRALAQVDFLRLAKPLEYMHLDYDLAKLIASSTVLDFVSEPFDKLSQLLNPLCDNEKKDHRDARHPTEDASVLFKRKPSKDYEATLSLCQD
jgi:hypothetical protein